MTRADHFAEAVNTLRASNFRLWCVRWFGRVTMEYDEALDRIVIVRTFRRVRYLA